MKVNVRNNKESSNETIDNQLQKTHERLDKQNGKIDNVIRGLFIIGFLSLNSDELSDSLLTLAILSNHNFATIPACKLVPIPSISTFSKLLSLSVESSDLSNCNWVRVEPIL